MRGMVIGGGIGGLAAAVALKRMGVDVRVFEQAPRIQEVGAGLSLWANAISALSQLGLADPIIRQGSIFRKARTLTDRGKLLTENDFTNINPDVPCVMAHRADLQQTLLAAVGEAQVTTGTRCVGIAQHTDHVEATFEDGSQETADFLIGADGIHSVVREQLFGPQQPRYSGFTCWRAIAEFTPAELPEDTSALFLGKGMQMGIFHCGAGRIYWFFAHPAPAGGQDGTRNPRAYLLDRFMHADSASLMRTTLESADESRIFRGDLIDRPPTWPWGKGRVTLLGDSVHSTTPNLGQGACQAIEDAVFLADSFRQNSDIPAALRHYEQRRRKRTAWVTRQSRQTGKMLGLSNPLLLWLRNAAFQSFVGKRSLQSTLGKLLNYEIPSLPDAPD